MNKDTGIRIEAIREVSDTGENGEETPPSAETKENAPIEIADRIVKLWAEGRLLFRNAKGQIETLKPFTK